MMNMNKRKRERKYAMKFSYQLYLGEIG